MAAALLLFVIVTATVTDTGHGSRDTATTDLFICSLLPYPDSRPSLQPSWSEGPTLYLVEQLAVDVINNRSDILSTYHLQLVQGDSGCDVLSKPYLSLFRHILEGEHRIAGIVGPGCSASTSSLSYLTGRSGIELVNVHVAGSTQFTDRTTYPYAFGTLDSTSVFAEGAVALMKHNKWSSGVAVLYDDSRLYYKSIFEEFIQRAREDLHLSVRFSSTVSDTYIPLFFVKQERFRVIFLLVGPDFLSRVLCLAQTMDLLPPNYQWIVVSRTAEEVREVKFRYNGMDVKCDDAQITRAVNGAIFLHYKLVPLNISQITETGLSYDEFDAFYSDLILKHNNRYGLSNVSKSFWGASYFDAVWALALALNNSIEPLANKGIKLHEYEYGQENATLVIRNQLLKLQFEGVSGKIEFNKETGFTNRLVDIFVANNSQMMPVGYYNRSSVAIEQVYESIFINDTFPTIQIQYTVHKAVSIIFLILTAAVCVCVAISHVMSIYYRNERVIKSSSPKLNQLAYVGCYIAITSLTFFAAGTFSDYKVLCISVQTLYFGTSVGDGILIGVALTKTWRLYRIFVHYIKPGRLISDSVLLGFVLAVAVVLCIINIVWIAVDPLLSSVYNDTLIMNRNIETFYFEQRIIRQCDSQYFFVWFTLDSSFGAILVATTAILAVLTHKAIPKQLLKPDRVIILAYFVCLSYIIGFGLYFSLRKVLQAHRNTNFMILFVTLLSPVIYYLLLIFIPPLLRVWK